MSLIHRSFKQCPQWLKEEIIKNHYPHKRMKARKLNKKRRYIKFVSSIDIEETSVVKGEFMKDVLAFMCEEDPAYMATKVSANLKKRVTG